MTAEREAAPVAPPLSARLPPPSPPRPIARKLQMTLFEAEPHPVLAQIQQIDLATLSPIEALNLLYQMQKDTKQKVKADSGRMRHLCNARGRGESVTVSPTWDGQGIGQRGLAIYDTKLKPLLEPQNNNQFVAIHVGSEGLRNRTFPRRGSPPSLSPPRAGWADRRSPRRPEPEQGLTARAMADVSRHVSAPLK